MFANPAYSLLLKAPAGGGVPPDVTGWSYEFDAQSLVGLNDGDAIASGGDFSQASAGLRPLYRPTGLNSLPAAEFASDILDSGAFSLSQPHTIAVVAKVTATGWVTQFGSEIAGILSREPSGVLRMFSGGALDSAVIDWGEPRVIIAVFNGGSSVNSVDGAEVTGNAGSTGTSVGITLGSVTVPVSMLLGQARVYPTALSSPDRAALRARLNYLWDIA